jgi:hypothetical protein
VFVTLKCGWGKGISHEKTTPQLPERRRIILPPFAEEHLPSMYPSSHLFYSATTPSYLACLTFPPRDAALLVIEPLQPSHLTSCLCQSNCPACTLPGTFGTALTLPSSTASEPSLHLYPSRDAAISTSTVLSDSSQSAI